MCAVPLGHPLRNTPWPSDSIACSLVPDDEEDVHDDDMRIDRADDGSSLRMSRSRARRPRRRSRDMQRFGCCGSAAAASTQRPFLIAMCAATHSAVAVSAALSHSRRARCSTTTQPSAPSTTRLFDCCLCRLCGGNDDDDDGGEGFYRGSYNRARAELYAYYRVPPDIVILKVRFVSFK